MSEEDQPVNEEFEVPAERGIFGGQSTYTTGTGIRTIRRIAVCDRCGRVLNGDYIFCRCHRKVCSRCVAYYEIDNIYLCLDCVQNRLPLGKMSYLVLSGFTRLSNRKEISEAALIKDCQTRKIVRLLTAFGFLDRKGFPPFSRYELTHEGAVALATYRQVYGEHPDVLEFGSRLMKKEIERNGRRR